MATNVVKSIEQDAKQRAELSPEAKRAKFAQIRQRMGVSRLHVTAPPGIHVCWARRNDEAELDRLRYLGYEIVRETDPKSPRFKAFGLREDGTYVIGDVILMQCPQEVYEAIVQSEQEEAAAARNGAQNEFIENARQAGVEAFEVTRNAREK